MSAARSGYAGPAVRCGEPAALLRDLGPGIDLVCRDDDGGDWVCHPADGDRALSAWPPRR